MSKSKHVSSETVHQRKSVGEKNLGKSMTIQGDNVDIKTALERHRKGLPVFGTKKAPVYTGGELIEDLDSMDEVDRTAYLDSVADHLIEVKARIAANAKTEEDKKRLKEIDDAVKERLEQMRNKATEYASEEMEKRSGNEK